MQHYTTHGSGQSLILIHGFPSDHTTWDALVPELSQSFRLFLPDLQGAGSSAGVPNETLRIEQMAEGILTIIKNENLDKVVIAGHSMGGYTAMACLELFPEYIQGLSMIHSLANADSEEKKVTRRKSIQLVRKGDDAKERFLKEMAYNLFAVKYADSHPEHIKSVLDMGMKLDTESLVNFYTAMIHRPDRTQVLKDNPIPIQWIIGSEDKATPMETALSQSYLAEVNDVHIYDGVGHMSMYENTDQLIQDLSSFCHFCWNR